MPFQEVSIGANSIQGAADTIIAFLERTRQGDVLYLAGSYYLGLGGSAILRAVVKRLRSSSPTAATSTNTGKAGGLEKHKIIHVDCSVWQSKRSLQKAIAAELRLPQEVMALFDQGDEEDDFYGVERAARGVIAQVKGEILEELSACEFLVVFHNGSGSYVDLWECGVPVLGGARSKRVLWASRASFRAMFPSTEQERGDALKEAAGLSDVAISVVPDPLLSGPHVFMPFLHAEAEELARCSGVPDPDTNNVVALKCFLYKAMIQMDSSAWGDININWGTHAANYWVCDGIIPQDTNNDLGRSSWDIGEALQRNMDFDLEDVSNRVALRSIMSIAEALCQSGGHWVSATGSYAAAAVQVPPQATSFFCRNASSPIVIHSDSSSSRLRVLHLSHCTFSFASPPFQRCRNLRFLLLDHCQDKSSDDGSAEAEERRFKHDCFRNLWVLVLSYADWYWLLSRAMLNLMAELRELNVQGGSDDWCLQHTYTSSILKLRVAAVKLLSPSFPDLSRWHILKTLVLDGCGELEEIGCDSLPPSLESFSLISSDIMASKIRSISVRGRTKLKSLLLRGLFQSLLELDVSGTPIETLDLSATRAASLRRLFLLGCEELRAILWLSPEEEVTELEVLRIDTKTNAAWCSNNVVPSESTTLVHGQALSGSDSYVFVRDARLFRSLQEVNLAGLLHVKISSSPPNASGGHRGDSSTNNQAQAVYPQKQATAGRSTLLYAHDTVAASLNLIEDNLQGSNGGGVRWMWPCPCIPTTYGNGNGNGTGRRSSYCYISIEDETHPTQLLQRTLPHFVHNKSVTPHLHDCLSITSIPGPTPSTGSAVDLSWSHLKWCRIERCPKLQGSVFNAPSATMYFVDAFEDLETFWASQLLEARYIWDFSTTITFLDYSSFQHLVFLHLDSCPRLVHVLVVPGERTSSNEFRSLETLEIMCCGELREVFSSISESPVFPNLKRIHLYELPKLRRICGHMMRAPILETVKIRGCWSLKRMPAVRRALDAPVVFDSEEEEVVKLPTVDCEKDWWDGLEWDGEEAGHHHSYYRPRHSSYYKKTLLRSSVLR